MKFKKDGAILKNVEDAFRFHCNNTMCEKCHFSCRRSPELHPEITIELLKLSGFEIIEDNSDATPELPLDIGCMTIAQAKEYCKHLMGENLPCEKICKLRKSGICGSGGLPCDWKLERVRLTPEELAICKAVGAKWVSMDKRPGETQVALWGKMPVYNNEGLALHEYGSGVIIASVCRDRFPNVQPGDCIYIGDLIKGDA